MSQLSGDFLIELAKACIISKDILDVVKPHLKYSYLPNEPYKLVFKYLFDYHSANATSPTIGLVAQNVNSRDAIEIVGKIREVNVYNSKEQIIVTLEEFIRRGRFIELHKKVEDLFNSQKLDEAIGVMASESKEINDFSLKNKLPARIFASFEQRQEERQNKDHTTRKIPTGIPAFDYHTRGGVDRGTGILGIARSGVGKTTFLRSLGMNAAFRGINVLHFAAGDSTQEEVENGYDSWWTGVDMHLIKEGKIDASDEKKIEKARKAWLAQCGEVYVHVFKQFNAATIADCRNMFIELSKEVEIGMVLFDYLELFDPGDGKRYGTNQEGISAKKNATAEKIINVGTEFDVVVGTVTQASDIKKEFWNNINWFITRNDISNLKATINPFAYCITLNQTDDENDREEMRIHEEKLRHYNNPSFSATYPIIQNRAVGRFIDVGKTKEKFWDDEKKQIIRNVPKA